MKAKEMILSTIYSRKMPPKALEILNIKTINTTAICILYYGVYNNEVYEKLVN